MWEIGYLTVLQVRLGAKIGDRHAKDSNAFRKRLMCLSQIAANRRKPLKSRLTRATQTLIFACNNMPKKMSFNKALYRAYNRAPYRAIYIEL